MKYRSAFAAASLCIAVAACSQPAGNSLVPSAENTAAVFQALPDSGTDTSILKLLVKQAVVGSTVDSANGDKTPHGLTVAAFSFGKITKDDVYVCNSADKSGSAGAGTTVEAIASGGGSPKRFTLNAKLAGCGAIALDGGDNLWVASSATKAEIELTDTGSVKSLYTKGYEHPFGTAYADDAVGGYGETGIFTSDAANGSITLAEVCQQGMCSYPNRQVVTGFPVSAGKNGTRGPLGLAYDPKACGDVDGKPTCFGALFVVDGADGTIVQIENPLNLNAAKSIVVGSSGKTFSGPDASWAHVFYSGKLLAGPAGATMLYHSLGSLGGPGGPGNLAVANTADPKGKNLILEFAPNGKLLDSVNVDTGNAGGLYELQAVGYAATTKVYFTDDNSNTVDVLEK